MNVVTNPLPTGTWAVDPVHSAVSFEVQHMGLSNFTARFRSFDIQLVAEDGHEQLRGSVRTDSLDILDDRMREHLLAPDFLDAEHHPELLFASDALQLSDGTDDFRVTGALTIRGIKRDVTAVGTITPAVEDPFGNQRLAASLVVIVDRRDFGIDYEMAMPSGVTAIGYEVTLVASLELVRAS